LYKGYDPNRKPDSKKKGKEEAPKFKIVGSFVGKDMVGWRFTPIFDYFTEQVSRMACSHRRVKLTRA